MNPASEARFPGPTCHRCAELSGDRAKLTERCAELRRENERLRDSLGAIMRHAAAASFDLPKEPKHAEPE